MAHFFKKKFANLIFIKLNPISKENELDSNPGPLASEEITLQTEL